MWASDAIRSFCASWWFAGAHTVWFVGWFLLRLDVNTLTLAVSLEAIYLMGIVLMSEERQEDYDRAQAAHERESVEEVDALQQEQMTILRESRAAHAEELRLLRALLEKN